MLEKSSLYDRLGGGRNIRLPKPERTGGILYAKRTGVWTSGWGLCSGLITGSRIDDLGAGCPKTLVRGR